MITADPWGPRWVDMGNGEGFWDPTDAWVLINVDNSGLYEVERDDELNVLPDDDAAVHRVRLLARKGHRAAIEALAWHQHDKRALRAYRRS